MRTVSSGGGHGPILLKGKSEAAGAGGHLRQPREILIPTMNYQGDFYLGARFFTSGE
jgi:hypothetical protein